MSPPKTDREKPVLHQGPDHASPYPVSRLAPSFSLVDLAREIEQANAQVATRVSGQLHVIAEQVKALQSQARQILEQARSDRRLHEARCGFRRRPGHVYHVYEEPDGSWSFSMLSPQDWKGQPPRPFVGSFRLEADMSWTSTEKNEQPDDSRQLVTQLLAATGMETEG